MRRRPRDDRPRLWIDIETYSTVDLLKYGVYPYAASPDFRILMAAWSVDGETVHVALDEDDIKAIPGLLDPGVLKVAHNAAFERVCFSHFFEVVEVDGTYLPPEDWWDTQVVAAELGLPQKLGMLSRALGAEPKDEAGTRLINLFSKPNRKGGRTTPADKPLEWLDFITYCEQDVYTLIDVDKRLGRVERVPAEELATFHVDQRINDRGIAVDVDMARHAVKVAEENQLRQKAAISLIAGIDNPNSQPQMMAWVREQNLDADNLQKATVERLLASDELTAEQRQVLRLRQELALVASKKYAAAIGGATDGPDGPRLRGSLRFFGAHTGRWAGRGVQLQNLPREQLETEDDTDAAISRLKSGDNVDAHTLKALVRALFTGPFTVVDYSAIEARVIAWLADERWALEAFEAGRDIYVETAERMSTATQTFDRSEGKVAVLALGYNGGVNSLRAMGAEGDDDELRMRVEQWRRANPRITRLWRGLGDGFAEPGRVGRRLHITEGEDALGRLMRLHLPSGRAISYHGVKWERYSVEDPVTGRYVSKKSWRYADPKNPFNRKQRIGTYGGRLAENATQAVARDILAAALVRLDEAGYRVVGHVHDEVIIEGLHDVDEVAAIMSETPDWADGLPISGEGFTCRRYRKD